MNRTQVATALKERATARSFLRAGVLAPVEPTGGAP